MLDEGDLWDRAGREAVGASLDDAGFDVEQAVRELTIETMYRGADPRPEQIRRARMALNDCRRILEEQVAPAAGCDEWGDPHPHISKEAARYIAGCPTEDTDE